MAVDDKEFHNVPDCVFDYQGRDANSLINFQVPLKWMVLEASRVAA